VDSAPELGKKSAWHMVFDAKRGNTERGRRRSLPGIPLGRSISGGLGRWPTTSSTDVSRRGGPLVVGLLRKRSKRSRRVAMELDEVLVGHEDQQDGTVAIGLELYSCDGETHHGITEGVLLYV
jgi:hypothetical protein